jgi:hypothetical protein
MHKGARGHGRLPKGVTLLLKATLPTCAPNRHGLSLLQHAPRPSPAARGLGPACRANRLRSRRSQTAARGANNRPAVTSDPPLLPRPTGERGGQPCRRHATAPSGRASPTPDTVAGGREQRSRRQPSSRPIRGQQENPLSRREDNAPVIRSSNGSRTRNGCPANRSPRRINSTAGQAALPVGAVGDASPSP